ncbi:hypothetical protein [Desmospora activa]|uniref:Uncharacterized protein n=1 Tax=Desmospora activa DSM 45169 TaxID=1121389 RepID=A0A2T4Z206_9BACL|nr:hypothetical protein [Desmospora activa]PTM54771.1 hypothetical protein C8J48_3423 [Desmospora activa DSM 45169]
MKTKITDLLTLRFFHRRFTNKEGNATVIWVVSLPVFMVFLSFLASMATAWIGHSYSMSSADAISLAITKKMDEWVQRERIAQMTNLARRNGDLQPGDPGYIDPYNYLLGTEAKRETFMRRVIKKYENQIQSTAREYAEKNGGGQSGVVRFSKGGRVEVIAETPYEPQLFKDAIPYDRVKGSSVGPKRSFFEWIPDSSAEEVRY